MNLLWIRQKFDVVLAGLLRRLIDGADHSFDSQRDFGVDLISKQKVYVSHCTVKKICHIIWSDKFFD